jgi:hypothetical protein
MESIKPIFLEKIGGVKTARLEADSVLLAGAALSDIPAKFEDSDRLLRLVKRNKVLLRVANLFSFPAEAIDAAKHDAKEAFELYYRIGGSLSERRVSYVSIKSFDSLPDIGHDVDLLVPVRSDFRKAEKLLLEDYKVRPSELTHCDKMVGKFSCFLPGYKLDFEIYPNISQLGEKYLELDRVLNEKKAAIIEGREAWFASASDRIMIRVIHVIFRHKSVKRSDILDFLKLLNTMSVIGLLEKVQEARICEAFLYYLACVDRFLTATGVDSLPLKELQKNAENRFGYDHLRLFESDRLILPYRTPTRAIIILYLFKAGREVSAGKLTSTTRCLVAPPLLIIEFLVSAIRSGGRGGIW